MEATAESSKDVTSLNHRLNSNKGTQCDMGFARPHELENLSSASIVEETSLLLGVGPLKASRNWRQSMAGIGPIFCAATWKPSFITDQTIHSPPVSLKIACRPSQQRVILKRFGLEAIFVPLSNLLSVLPARSTQAEKFMRSRGAESKLW
jgi:hypothetical protein